ncbi:MAG: DNA polymerase/3'-5' exonuclease PolX [Candidatus Riflebacteria bacterium]|nr:DNA polymerase/3'-5' exonuclease PolX [Candidatus Riflebacteria bacterium]
MMESKDQLATLFEEIAEIHEFLGENVFKIRAFRNAARTLENFQGPLSMILENPPQGFGKGLLAKTEEFLRTGKVEEFETLSPNFPSSLREVFKIPGLGSKKIRILHDVLKVSSVADLEKACLENKVAEIKGFGDKSQRMILAGIEQIKQYSGRFLFSTASKVAEEVLSKLSKKFPGISFSLAGSLRRKMETVKDADILAISDSSTEIMETFAKFSETSKVLSQGESKTSIIHNSGIQIDLRVIPTTACATGTLHFTGSKEFNTKLRSLAKNQGKRLNEYGLWKEEKSSVFSNEDEVLRELGLSFIPPELREDLGEVEEALKGKTFQLVEEKDLKGLLHMHSNWSDGEESILSMANAAMKQGFEWIGITDHSEFSRIANGMEPERARNQHKEIEELNKNFRNFRIFKGVECDILPNGNLDYPPELLSKYDFVIISAHSKTSDTEKMTERLQCALENPFSDIWGHPTNRLLLEREPYPMDIDKLLDVCLKKKTILEINAHPKRLDLDWRMIRKIANLGHLFSIGCDAHDTDELSAYKFGIGIARKGGLTKEQIINCLSADEFLAKIKARKQFSAKEIGLHQNETKKH